MTKYCNTCSKQHDMSPCNACGGAMFHQDPRDDGPTCLLCGRSNETACDALELMKLAYGKVGAS